MHYIYNIYNNIIYEIIDLQNGYFDLTISYRTKF